MKVLITGSNGQLGRAFSSFLFEAGHTLVLVDKKIDEDNFPNSKRVFFENIDLTANGSLDEIGRKHGDVDVLINNAGVGVFTDFLEREEWEIKEAIMLNLHVPIFLTKLLLQGMVQRRNGNIINIASLYGVVSSDYRIYGDSGRNNSETYSATKAGLIGFTKYVAANFGHLNIRCNSITPGGVRKKQSKDFVKNYEMRTPLGRMASEADIVAGLEFLISSKSEYVTGHNLIIDGGFSAW